MTTAFSTGFNTTFKFEVARKFWNCSKSASDFFNAGDSIATFRTLGTTPVDKDRLMILVIVGSNTVRQPFKTTAGRGSSSQDLDSGFLENFFSRVTPAKLQNSATQTLTSGGEDPTRIFLSTSPLCILSILLVKKSANEFARAVTSEERG